MTEIPVCHTPRLVLRGYEPQDLEAVFRMVQDEETLRFLPHKEPWEHARVQTWLESQRVHWDEYGFGWWLLEARVDARVLGWCGLRRLQETGEVELLYLLEKTHWGHGLATEAARAAVEFAFTQTDLKEIVGLVDVGHGASQRVLEKAGMAYAGNFSYFGMHLKKYCLRAERFLETGGSTCALC